MKVAVFDTHEFDRGALAKANQGKHDLVFLEVRLSETTAPLAAGCEAVCLFANDRADDAVLTILGHAGIKLIALRSAGFNHVDIRRAKELGMTVVRVPEYSPYAVAEFAVALLLTFNRKTHKAHNRVHDMNFSLNGLVGFDLHGKTVGVIGTGRIGKAFAQIMRGFGCRVLATDKTLDVGWARLNAVNYVEMDSILRECDVISLHVPLNESTQHMIDTRALQQMKKNAILINTGRGGLIDAAALIKALKMHSIGGACLDVYEEEAGIFFSDLSVAGIDDDVLARLLTFPDVLITSHQAFLTAEALAGIAETTIASLSAFEAHGDLSRVSVEPSRLGSSCG
jgi:D-lactate dehydrogenase